MNLIWFRNDLRVQDHVALSEAMANGPTLALFLFCPEQWRSHAVGPARLGFLLRCLQDLERELGKLNVPLLWQQVTDFAAVPNAVMKIASAQGVTNVYASEEQPLNERIRDSKVAIACQEQNIEFHLHPGGCLLPPGSVRKGDGGAYSVFTPFKKQWLKQITASHYQPIPTPEKQRQLKVELTQQPALPTTMDGTAASHLAERWPGGSNVAHERLRQFVEQPIDNYQSDRDIPSQPGTSTLSPYLSIGAISARECLNAAIRINHGELIGNNEGVNIWVSELVWRDFYRHVITLYPHVNKHQPFRDSGKYIPWREDHKEFVAWCEGRTGYPLVDAAMRQLTTTGWMHNRLRMVSAMFLTKHLLLPWRWGEDFFMQHLVDGDFAANNGGWQWSASTGTDAAPYFRIFNPASQAERFDPDGDFVCTYLPELQPVRERLWHAKGAQQKSGKAKSKKVWFDPGKANAEERQWFQDVGYPAPIVEHAFARQRALDTFKNAPQSAPLS